MDIIDATILFPVFFYILSIFYKLKKIQSAFQRIRQPWNKKAAGNERRLA